MALGAASAVCYNDGMATTREQIKLDGRAALRPGVEVTIRGLGRCRYGSAELADDGTIRWVNVYERRNGGCRSVAADRIATVHHKAKLR